MRSSHVSLPDKRGPDWNLTTFIYIIKLDKIPDINIILFHPSIYSDYILLFYLRMSNLVFVS